MHHDGVCRALVADNSSDAFLQQWIATSAKLYSDVVQVTLFSHRAAVHPL